MIEDALEVANLPTLLMVLVHLTGERRWLDPPYRPSPGRGLDDNDSGGLPPEVQREIREAALAARAAWRAGTVERAPVPTDDELARMLAASVGEPVGCEYGPMIAAELGLRPASEPARTGAVPSGFHVVVVGAGPSGIAVGVELGRAGIGYTVLEKNECVGGTWEENRYPGCGCDTPSHLYSYSFAPDPTRWSRYYARRDEIHGYLDECAERHAVSEHVVLGTEVLRATFDTTSEKWRVDVRDDRGRVRTLTADAVISAVGLLNRPKFPALRGLRSFRGPVVHTARWNGLDVAGRRVGVVGTGASAMQLVPAIADDADRLIVFQRSPQWAMPNPNYRRPVSDATRELFDELPFYAAWYRVRLHWLLGDRVHASLQVDPAWPHADRSVNPVNDSVRRFLTSYIEAELGDRCDDLLGAVLPRYPPFAKRMLMDNGWFRTIARDDVDLVTSRIAKVVADGVVTGDGRHHALDAIVLATGFETLDFLRPMEIRGRSGRTIAAAWGEKDATAYLGITVPDFPNLFLMYGPNTNLHGGSILFNSECQARYIVSLIGQMLDAGARTVECRRDVHDAYMSRVDEAHARMVWARSDVRTYFKNALGRVVTNTPWRLVDYWHMTRVADLDDYEMSHG